MIWEKTLINFHPIQLLVNPFRVKEMKNVHALLRIKNWQINMLLQYHVKNVSFIPEDLQLIEKDKKGAVKLDKPAFTGQTYLGKSQILLYEVKCEYMLSKWGKKGQA